MKHALSQALTWSFGAGVAVAITFGANQAFAAPVLSDGTGVCKDDLCRTFCQTVGFGTGWCESGQCRCYID
ncbi:MAG TPA: hypothetical protein VGR37_18730 [Longimicrobiaceae bacterium]|nr:hypothetical protein [Longimicrobiaceae bacterium]